MECRVAPLNTGDPALEDSAWSQLVTDGRAEEDRAYFLAYADSIENKTHAISLWDGNRLCGFATAVEFERASGAPIFSLELMASAGCGLRVGKSVDRRVALGDLLGAAVDYARDNDKGKVVLANASAEDDELASAAAAYGFRKLAAAPDHRIDLPERIAFETYLAHRLSTRYRTQLRRDLRRAVDAGAEIRHDHGASSEILEAGWKMYIDKLSRKNALGYRFRQNLFAAFAGRFEASRLVVSTGWRNGELIGVVVSLVALPSWNIAYVGHAGVDDLHVVAALQASTLQHAVELGAQRFTLGPTEDVYKVNRLGATSLPRTSYFRLPTT